MARDGFPLSRRATIGFHPAVPRPPVIDLGNDVLLPVLHADRDVWIIDKPAGWRAGPDSVPPTTPAGADLQGALDAALAAGPAWATDHGVESLRILGSLDTEASGLLMLARSPRAWDAFRRQFDRRPPRLESLAIVGGKPNRRRWSNCLKIRPNPDRPGQVLTHTTQGQYAETNFEVLAHGDGMALLLAQPRTFRPHQIRAQLAAQGLPVLGDRLYGFGRDTRRPMRPSTPAHATDAPGEIALRAARLVYTCPFSARPVEVQASLDVFLARYGFELDADEDPESRDPAS